MIFLLLPCDNWSVDTSSNIERVVIEFVPRFTERRHERSTQFILLGFNGTGTRDFCDIGAALQLTEL